MTRPWLILVVMVVGGCKGSDADPTCEEGSSRDCYSGNPCCVSSTEHCSFGEWTFICDHWDIDCLGYPDSTTDPDAPPDAPDDVTTDLDDVTDTPDATYDDCPEPGTFVFELDWTPEPGWRYATSTGTVTSVMEDPAGTLAITVDLTSGDHEPGFYNFGVPLSGGIDIDLHAGDAVSVTTHDMTSCIGCPLYHLIVERDGDVVLDALDCSNEICNEPEFSVGPLSFSVIKGICEPWEDGPGESVCFIKESCGLHVICDGESVHADLFQGQQASMSCADGAYHVLVGRQDRVLDVPEDSICFDWIQDVRQYLVIRHGTGLADGDGGSP